MLEPRVYRLVELLAKSQLPSWLVSQPHNLDHFERSAFPVKVETVAEVGQLLDTMQEGRFDGYMNELGGIADVEYSSIVAACVELAQLQISYFPNRTPIIPLSTVLSSFSLIKKMTGAIPGFRRVLEIGPGCGYLSFFLKSHQALENYSQVEACQSFYILQNLVNLHCFGRRFSERALPAEPVLDSFVDRERKGLEFSPRLQFQTSSPLCTHYPWWRLGDLAGNNRRFDVVTSNANLLEFNRSALDDYLTLFQLVMEPDGVFLAQCPGYPANGTYETLVEKLWEKGFALLAFIRENTPLSLTLSFRAPSALDFIKGDSRGSVTFVVNNLLLVRAGHPLFEKYRNKKNFQFGFYADEPLVESVFFSRPPNRRMRRWQDFVEDTERAVSATTR